ncbi:unnamed protein product [Rotaria socialis]|uniref:Uncharacterized protein n=1 Tax=Rotaria socialis TaxID=392032 RepID=A0A820GEM6_9BILA|nr:unnamed protein product [Rotaria socialis]CAF3406377.1 unnamed protein product [Rotaria socialis]CAF3445187.1 unnamed protein product [Rotaria socialis]CAF3450967.1 unnamed protein product [Rotaria socialis]CAF4185433.1 unnamed protein product [Rotaria socialis]
MAQALDDSFGSDLKHLMDCMHFISGRCNLNNNCPYRHYREAAEQTKSCPKWPKTCRNIVCPYRHCMTTALQATVKKEPTHRVILKLPGQLPLSTKSSMPSQGFISFFWDIENVPIPKGQKPFDIVQRIRQKLVVESGLQEADFSCFCNINTISQDNQQNLHHANVRIIHVPDRKPGAADRQIMLELDRFERIHRPPATVVLISGDIDFVGKLSDLRHQAGFHVIVIHNKPAKDELKATVHTHYPWEYFTTPQQQQLQSLMSADNNINSIFNGATKSTIQPNIIHASSSANVLRRRDPSLSSPRVRKNSSSIVSNQNIKVYNCPQCSNEFQTAEGLEQHQKVKNHLFYCPVCNESFVMEKSQVQHQKDKKHYIRDYKCDQCNHYFAKVESLNQHRNATGHTSSPKKSTANGCFVLQETSAVLSPSNRNNNNNDNEDPMLIILQGIEAIRQHYVKYGFISD